MNEYNTAANPQGHELGWDDEIQQESSFILLPEGDYRFTVEKFDRARHAGSANIPPCNKAIVHFRVFSPDGSSVLRSGQSGLVPRRVQSGRQQRSPAGEPVPAHENGMETVRVFRQHRHETEGAGGTDELVTGVRQVRRVPCENPHL